MKIILILLLIAFSGCQKSSTNKVETNVDAEMGVEAEVETKAVVDMAPKNCDKAFELLSSKLEHAGSGFKPFWDFYKSSHKCLDASYSVRFKGLVAVSLNQDWGQLEELNTYFKKNSRFKNFFLANIEAYVSGSEHDLKAVIKKSTSRCPKKLSSLCTEISTKSLKAIEYADSQ